MVQIKGLKKLIAQVDKLQLVKEEIQRNIEEKREWMDSKSDKWLEGDEASKWNDHLDEVETLLEEIDSLTVIEIN